MLLPSNQVSFLCCDLDVHSAGRTIIALDYIINLLGFTASILLWTMWPTIYHILAGALVLAIPYSILFKALKEPSLVWILKIYVTIRYTLGFLYVIGGIWLICSYFIQIKKCRDDDCAIVALLLIFGIIAECLSAWLLPTSKILNKINESLSRNAELQERESFDTLRV